MTDDRKTDEKPNYLGCVPDTEHRTVGPHRAWCLTCGEWCSPSDPCSCGRPIPGPPEVP